MSKARGGGATLFRASLKLPVLYIASTLFDDELDGRNAFSNQWCTRDFEYGAPTKGILFLCFD